MNLAAPATRRDDKNAAVDIARPPCIRHSLFLRLTRGHQQERWYTHALTYEVVNFGSKSTSTSGTLQSQEEDFYRAQSGPAYVLLITPIFGRLCKGRCTER